MKSANQAIQTLLEDSLEFVEEERARNNIQDALGLLEAVESRERNTLREERLPPNR